MLDTEDFINEATRGADDEYDLTCDNCSAILAEGYSE